MSAAGRKFTRKKDTTKQPSTLSTEMIQQILVDTPIRHPPFNAATLDDLRKIQEVFAEVYPITLREWEDGFQRDTHPRRKIDLWLRMADQYTAAIEGRDLSFDERKSVYDQMLTASFPVVSTDTFVQPPDDTDTDGGMFRH